MDVEQRRPVWIAMSDLFLDTDVRIWYPYVALAAARSPYSNEELEAIFLNEVAPVVSGNLLSVAGEWAGFDEEWLVTRIQSRVERGLANPRWRPLSALVRKDWIGTARLVVILRKTDPADWDHRARIWSALSTLFLDGFLTPEGTVHLKSEQDLDSIWRDEIWPAYAYDEDRKRRREIDSAYEMSRVNAR